MPAIVSIHSYRGGTGKSNVTANLAVSVAMSGKRVGIVDTDIQSPGVHKAGLKVDVPDTPVALVHIVMSPLLPSLHSPVKVP